MPGHQEGGEGVWTQGGGPPPYIFSTLMRPWVERDPTPPAQCTENLRTFANACFILAPVFRMHRLVRWPALQAGLSSIAKQNLWNSNKRALQQSHGQSQESVSFRSIVPSVKRHPVTQLLRLSSVKQENVHFP